MIQKTIKEYVTMVFAKTRRVPTIVFVVQALVVSIVIMTFLNVCLLHVNTGVLAKIKLTPSYVSVLQATKVTLARSTSTNAHQIPANMTLNAYRALPPLHATVNQDILEQIVKPILMNVRQPLVYTTELAQTVSMSTFVTVPTQAMKDQIVKSTSMSVKAIHVPTMLHAWTASKTTIANVSQATRAKIARKIFTNVI
jgi:hypothetical protein